MSRPCVKGWVGRRRAPWGVSAVFHKWFVPPGPGGPARPERRLRAGRRGMTLTREQRAYLERVADGSTVRVRETMTTPTLDELIRVGLIEARATWVTGPRCWDQRERTGGTQGGGPPARRSRGTPQSRRRSGQSDRRRSRLPSVR